MIPFIRVFYVVGMIYFVDDDTCSTTSSLIYHTKNVQVTFPQGMRPVPSF